MGRLTVKKTFASLGKWLVTLKLRMLGGTLDATAPQEKNDAYMHSCMAQNHVTGIRLSYTRHTNLHLVDKWTKDPNYDNCQMLAIAFDGKNKSRNDKGDGDAEFILSCVMFLFPDHLDAIVVDCAAKRPDEKFSFIAIALFFTDNTFSTPVLTHDPEDLKMLGKNGQVLWKDFLSRESAKNEEEANV